MKALGFPLRDDIVVSVIEEVRNSSPFRAGHVKDMFEKRGVSPLLSSAATDNLLRRMKRADLISVRRLPRAQFPYWFCN
jgi:hypothetical protein